MMNDEDTSSQNAADDHRPIYPLFPLKPDRLIKLKIFFSHITNRMAAFLSISMGMTITLIWSSFHPAIYSGRLEENLASSFILFFFGLGGFFLFRDKESSTCSGPRGHALEFHLAIMGLCWGLALLALYIFLSQTIHISIPQFCPPTTWICKPL